MKFDANFFLMFIFVLGILGVVCFLVIWTMLVVAKKADGRITENIFFRKFKQAMLDTEVQCVNDRKVKCSETISPESGTCLHCYHVWLGKT